MMEVLTIYTFVAIDGPAPEGTIYLHWLVVLSRKEDKYIRVDIYRQEKPGEEPVIFDTSIDQDVFNYMDGHKCVCDVERTRAYYDWKLKRDI